MLIGVNLQNREADKQEDIAAEIHRERVAGLEEGGDESAAAISNMRIDDAQDAVCLINSVGIIQMTNKFMHRLFGYKKVRIHAAQGMS